MSEKLRTSEWIALAGALVMFVATFLPWFALPSAAEIARTAPGARLVGGGDDGAINLNVWDLGFARWWVYLAILLGVCMVLAALLSRTPEWSIILCTPLVVASSIAFLCLLVRLFDSPRPFASAQLGFYLAFAGSAALLAGTCWAIRDTSVPEGFDKAPRPELIHVE
ncbi:MAG: hypothetical protein JHD02_10930 [Thermoleophilaceae bacterium]|nr:hypothetical protein [Thermoleophilaceae bacterium]